MHHRLKPTARTLDQCSHKLLSTQQRLSEQYKRGCCCVAVWIILLEIASSPEQTSGRSGQISRTAQLTATAISKHRRFDRRAAGTTAESTKTWQGEATLNRGHPKLCWYSHCQTSKGWRCSWTHHVHRLGDSWSYGGYWSSIDYFLLSIATWDSNTLKAQKDQCQNMKHHVPVYLEKRCNNVKP